MPNLFGRGRRRVWGHDQGMPPHFSPTVSKALVASKQHMPFVSAELSQALISQTCTAISWSQSQFDPMFLSPTGSPLRTKITFLSTCMSCLPSKRQSSIAAGVSFGTLKWTFGDAHFLFFATLGFAAFSPAHGFKNSRHEVKPKAFHAAMLQCYSHARNAICHVSMFQARDGARHLILTILSDGHIDRR